MTLLVTTVIVLIRHSNISTVLSHGGVLIILVPSKLLYLIHLHLKYYLNFK